MYKLVNLSDALTMNDDDNTVIIPTGLMQLDRIDENKPNQAVIFYSKSLERKYWYLLTRVNHVVLRQMKHFFCAMHKKTAFVFS